MTKKNPLLMVLLLPFSFLYLFAVLVNKFIFNIGIKKQKKLPGQTISIGNIVAGGTGKSPVVIALVEHLKKQGHKPVVLTRGYKSGLKSNQALLFVNGSVKESMNNPSEGLRPDEAIMQSVKLQDTPIVVSAKRYDAAQWYMKKTNTTPTHWILDDGFQHWKIDRDIDVVLLDSKNPFGGGFVLPVGMLREPLDALKRASCIVFTRKEENFPKAKVREYVNNLAKKPTFDCEFSNGWPIQLESSQSLDKDFNGSAFLVSALANSERFKSKITELGIEVGSYLYKKDHEKFIYAEIEAKLGKNDIVVTTAKDYWRDPDIFRKLPIPTYVSEVNVSGLDSCFSQFFTD